jgi:ABC-type branched-subunit amino acid transport system permease subunit
VIAGEAHVGRGAFVGAVVGARVTVEDGARVLMTTPQAAALGAAFGAVIGLLALRRRG